MLQAGYAAIALVQAQFLDPSKGPEQSGDFRVSPTFFLVLLVAGFIVGSLGHLVRSKTLVAAGVLMIFLATVLLPLGLTVGR